MKMKVDFYLNFPPSLRAVVLTDILQISAGYIAYILEYFTKIKIFYKVLYVSFIKCFEKR